MNWLDQVLSEALQRKPAPPGFSERLRNRLETEAKGDRRVQTVPRARVRLIWALAASLALPAAWLGHRLYSDYRATQAERLAMTALEIASSQLTAIEQQACNQLGWARAVLETSEFCHEGGHQ